MLNTTSFRPDKTTRKSPKANKKAEAKRKAMNAQGTPPPGTSDKMVEGPPKKAPKGERELRPPARRRFLAMRPKREGGGKEKEERRERGGSRAERGGGGGGRGRAAAAAEVLLLSLLLLLFEWCPIFSKDVGMRGFIYPDGLTSVTLTGTFIN